MGFQGPSWNSIGFHRVSGSFPINFLRFQVISGRCKCFSSWGLRSISVSFWTAFHRFLGVFKNFKRASGALEGFSGFNGFSRFLGKLQEGFICFKSDSRMFQTVYGTISRDPQETVLEF